MTTGRDRKKSAGVRVSDVVEGLRKDLLESMASRDPSWDPVFEIQEVEVELTCVAKQESQANGGVQFYVITVGGTESEEASVTQRVSLKLKPIKRTIRADGQNPALRGK